MILRFGGEYSWLSNFFLCQVGQYPSVEHAYQSAKNIEDEHWKETCKNPAITAGKIKRMGAKIELRDDWEEVKIPIMRYLIRTKFSKQNPELTELLLKTGEQQIFEGNFWGDKFWGVDSRTGDGENWLGKLLMKRREELEKERKEESNSKELR